MSEVKPIITINTNDMFGSSNGKQRMKKEDRLKFIDYLFDHVMDIESSSKKDASKKISKMFKDDHPNLLLNEMWVYRLLLAGIYKDSEGHYGFQNITEMTVEDVCGKPAAFERLMRKK